MQKTIKFIKEQNLGQQPVFFTEVNGNFVNGSLSSNYDEAVHRYNSICKGEQIKITETLQTFTIEQEEE
ncbi:MAG: hypothetical protein IM591_16355 [Chitinophagaceae bacterium]|uniref:hypothetical protein n=1 Tax=Microcystis sp. M061S2 TaxID=2771171 RepID=UPI00258D0A03|nr:hypothetical protein [Microcystis sp. M061S2]MCA2654875.1 hypothetical protein [Microcystis sp. M061S2]MCA6471945.1 hypothetical protein [Chitinophagaceae bacterium]